MLAGLLPEKMDAVDGLAAVLSAQAGIIDLLLGGWLLLTFVLAPLGILLVLFGLGALWVMRGIVDRNGDVWWIGVLLAVLTVGTLFVPVPNLTAYLPNAVGAIVGLAALAYFIVRRRRFGIGVRGTTAY